MLMCAAQLMPANTRHETMVRTRRSKLFTLNISLFSLPESRYFDARSVPALGNSTLSPNYVDRKGLTLFLATIKFSPKQTLIPTEPILKQSLTSDYLRSEAFGNQLPRYWKATPPKCKTLPIRGVRILREKSDDFDRQTYREFPS